MLSHTIRAPSQPLHLTAILPHIVARARVTGITRKTVENSSQENSSPSQQDLESSIDTVTAIAEPSQSLCMPDTLTPIVIRTSSTRTVRRRQTNNNEPSPHVLGTATSSSSHDSSHHTLPPPTQALIITEPLLPIRITRSHQPVQQEEEDEEPAPPSPVTIPPPPSSSATLKRRFTFTAPSVVVPHQQSSQQQQHDHHEPTPKRSHQVLIIEETQPTTPTTRPMERDEDEISTPCGEDTPRNEERNIQLPPIASLLSNKKSKKKRCSTTDSVHITTSPQVVVKPHTTIKRMDPEKDFKQAVVFRAAQSSPRQSKFFTSKAIPATTTTSTIPQHHLPGTGWQSTASKKRKLAEKARRRQPMIRDIFPSKKDEKRHID